MNLHLFVSLFIENYLIKEWGSMNTRVLKIISKAILMMPLIALSIQTQAAELEEIVVTAQKRSESLQEVPISIVAFSGEDIEKLNISNTIDLVKNIFQWSRNFF